MSTKQPDNHKNPRFTREDNLENGTKRTTNTLLGFDPGSKQIGIAVGQTLTNTANPLGVIAVKENIPDWRAIDRVLETWNPDALVVGLPLNMDGTEQEMTHTARRFQDQLAHRYRLPVYVADERLSTREAKNRLAQAGRLNEENDSVAAQIILETWLHEPIGD